MIHANYRSLVRSIALAAFFVLPHVSAQEISAPGSNSVLIRADDAKSELSANATADNASEGAIFSPFSKIAKEQAPEKQPEEPTVDSWSLTSSLVFWVIAVLLCVLGVVFVRSTEKR